MIQWDEIISATNMASTKMTNTVATNVLMNCHDKKIKQKIDYNI